MNKKLLVAAGVVILVIGAAVTYVLLSKNQAVEDTRPMTSESSTEQAELPVETPDAATPLQAGSYKDYSEADFAAITGTRLLFFHAPWCPQCRDLDASIKSSQLPDGVTVFKIDYDSNQSLRAKYGVTLQTTVVKVDSAGNKVASFVAYNEPNFASVQQALLP